MTTITMDDIKMHRELMGQIWCEKNSHTDGDFSTMNFKKIAEPDTWDFVVWTCGCPKPSMEDLLTITRAELDAKLALYS